MRRKLIGIFVCILLIVPIITIETYAIQNYDLLEGGWLEERDGVKILHVSGSYYEMGFQHGYLLRDEIPICIRIMFGFFKDVGFSYDLLMSRWNILKTYVPKQYITEMQGIADGAGISSEEIFVLNTWHDTVNYLSCCGAMMWGSATANGELIHLRSGDVSIYLQDSETGTYLQDLQVIIVYSPENAFASMSPMLVGCVGSYGGINEKGIAVSETTVKTNDTTLQGACAGFLGWD